MQENELFEAVLNFDQATAKRIVQQALEEGGDLDLLLNNSLIAAMDEVGRRFSEGTMFVPEMFLAAHTFQACIEIMRPHLIGTDQKKFGKVVIGTVKGDMHDIGKNMVSMMMENGGFEVIDLGVDVEAEKFVQAVSDEKADILGLSALLTTTLPYMQKVVDLITQRGLRGQVKIIIGGAPVNEAFAKKIKADGYGRDAPSAVRLAKNLLS